MSELPPVLWQHHMRDYAALRRRAAQLEEIVSFNSRGLGPLFDLIARLRRELKKGKSCRVCACRRKHAPGCTTAALINEVDQLVPNDDEA